VPSASGGWGSTGQDVLKDYEPAHKRGDVVEHGRELESGCKLCLVGEPACGLGPYEVDQLIALDDVEKKSCRDATQLLARAEAASSNQARASRYRQV
jgi:hypothetical protein